MKTAQSIENKPLNIIRSTLGPLFLILCCPPTVFLMWYTNVVLGGSLSALWKMIIHDGFFQTLGKIWWPVFFGSAMGWKIIGIFGLTQILLMRWIPGKLWQGPISPKGNVPLYKANGVLCFILTLVLFYVTSYQFHWFSPTIVYDHFGEILGALNIFSLFFCLFLYFKGRFFPSSTDASHSGNLIFDYYWGTELYPRLFGCDIKMFTNCRFGMMGWPLVLLSFAAKQNELYGLSDTMIVAVALQLIYVAKFFYWETGYLRSLDIMHDRAGYYICWGVLVWVPGFYTSPTLFLVNHPFNLGFPLASLIFLLGTTSILVNYLADRQRQRVRMTQGNCKVWGKKPAVTLAKYTTDKGEMKQNLLLASGWWGIARHFHYIPEILGAFLWSAPALFTHSLPYFYVIFLTILLIDRAFRDDRRCMKKYGKDWEKHCEKVPHKIIPYIV